MKQPPMMMMLIPDQVLQALKGSDHEDVLEGEPEEEEEEDTGYGGGMKGKGTKRGKCPMCGH